MTEAISRRSVASGLAVTAAGVLAGYLVARNSSAARPGGATSAANGYGYSYAPTAGGGGRLLVRLDQIPPGGGTVIAPDNVVVTRASDSSVHAFSSTCTHQGCTVSSVQNGVISCPCHGSRFDASTGKVLSGPAPRALPAVPVAVRGGGVYTG